MSAFSTAHRTRSAGMGGLLPLNPLDLLELADRLQWPCEDDECIQVLGAMDDAWRSLKDTGGE